MMGVIIPQSCTREADTIDLILPGTIFQLLFKLLVLISVAVCELYMLII